MYERFLWKKPKTISGRELIRERGREKRMEFWFRRESQAQRQQQQQQQQLCIADAFGDDVVALAVEKGNSVFFGGEDFMVDDLLDLGELETEEEEEKDDDDERHKETQQQGGGAEEEEKGGKEIVGVGVGEDYKKPDVSFEPEAAPSSSSPVSELTLPMHDGAELEWVSRIVDDSLSEFPTAAAAATVAAAKAPSLLAEKLTCHQHQPPPPPPAVLKSKRSKRARTLSSSSSSSSSYSNCSHSSSSSWGGGGPLLLLDALPTSTSSSSSCSSPLSSSPSPLLSSHYILAHHLFDHIPSLSSANTSSFLKKQSQIQNNPKMMTIKSKSKKKNKKRGRKPKAAAAAVHQGGKGERRCSHCGVNKTPQWRTGPEGAKTLCNACGVRYKSGRLLPEYRPACSPSFITHIHSNSHRKVMEMRRSKEPQEQDDEQEANGKDRFLPISSAA